MAFPSDDARGVTIATNNGDVGGGEVMLLRIAEACRSLGIPVRIVAPRTPSGVADAARAAGFTTTVLPADGRREWIRALRRWDRRHRRGVLWCNGLVPALATAGHRDRVVHLHQAPRGRAQRAAAWIARQWALTVLVPSESMARLMPHAAVLENWTARMPVRNERHGDGTFAVGFLGRLSVDKGVPVLAEAMRILDAAESGRYRLVLGGEPLFIDDAQRARVEEALAAAGSIVERRGWVQPAALFDDIDVLVVPSVAEESFGLVAAEAMAARTPVIVTTAGALPEVVGAHHPLTVAPGDARALAALIADLAQGRMPVDTEAAHRRWSELYSPEAGARRVDRVLTAVSRAARS